jgi:UDP-N-acetylglucosamine acyltransferase
VKAHRTALVDAQASVADDVEIGPFCVIGPGVRIGPGCRLDPRVNLQGPAVIGRDNHFHAHVTVGRFGGGRVDIGDANIFRESSHVDAAAAGGSTRVGSRNRFGAWVGIGGGSSVGNDVRIGAFSVVGDGGTVEDGAWIEGQCVIDEERRVGRGSFICSQVPVCSDVPPYMRLDGNPSTVHSVNPSQGGAALEEAYEIAFKSGASYPEAARKIAALAGKTPEVAALAEFLKTAKPPEAAVE